MRRVDEGPRSNLGSYHEAHDARGRAVLLALAADRSAAEQHELTGLFERLGESALHRAAIDNRVEHHVGTELIDALPPGSPWRAAVVANGQTVARRVDGLVDAVSALERAGVAVAAIEGAGTLFAGTMPFSSYGSADFDLLVDRRAWSSTLRVLGALGWAPRDRRGRPTSRVEMTRELASGVSEWLEVGYQPFDRMWVPLGVNDRCETWLARRRRSPRGVPVDVLAPVDAIALTTMHASLHSWVRSPGLRLHVDVDRAVRDAAPDWGEVVREIRALGVGVRAYVSLAMARRLLATPVSDGALHALAPSAWRAQAILALLARSGVLSGPRPKLPRGQTILLDALISEAGLATWLRTTAVPGSGWMREHFDREHTGAPVWRLHLRRAAALARRWTPT